MPRRSNGIAARPPHSTHCLYPATGFQIASDRAVTLKRAASDTQIAFCVNAHLETV